MLTLRNDWLSITGGAVVGDLLAQLDTMGWHDEGACHLIGAGLDLLASTWPRRDQPPLTLEMVSKSTWRISSLHYIYLPANDDTVMNACIELARSSKVTAIMPRRHEKLKRQLLSAVLGGRTPNIWSIDGFISWRTTSATIDREWPPGPAVLELLNAYNRRIAAAGGSSAMQVQIPQESV